MNVILNETQKQIIGLHKQSKELQQSLRKRKQEGQLWNIVRDLNVGRIQEKLESVNKQIVSLRKELMTQLYPSGVEW